MSSLLTLCMLSPLSFADSTSGSESDTKPETVQLKSSSSATNRVTKQNAVMFSVINAFNTTAKISLHWGIEEQFSIAPILAAGIIENHTLLAGGVSGRWYFLGNNESGGFAHFETLVSQDQSDLRTDWALEGDLLVGGKVTFWSTLSVDGGLGVGYIYFPNHPNLTTPRIQFDMGYAF